MVIWTLVIQIKWSIILKQEPVEPGDAPRKGFEHRHNPRETDQNFAGHDVL